MGVQPGREHQKFIPSVYKKIYNLRKINKKITIQVDGGVSEKNIANLAKLKVNCVNSGSFISAAENPVEKLNALNKLFKNINSANS